MIRESTGSSKPKRAPIGGKGCGAVLEVPLGADRLKASRPSGEPDIARSRKTYQGFYGDIEMKLGGTRILRPLCGTEFF